MNSPARLPHARNIFLTFTSVACSTASAFALWTKPSSIWTLVILTTTLIVEWLIYFVKPREFQNSAFLRFIQSRPVLLIGTAAIAAAWLYVVVSHLKR
jgi:hypothetical protein